MELGEHGTSKHSSDLQAISSRYEKMVSSLQKAGFTREESICALGFTGYRSVRTASHWLCSHLNDPFATTDAKLEFFVLLCVGGELGDLIADFLSEAEKHMRWNKMREFPPHIEVLRFEASVAAVPEVHRAFRISVDSIRTSIVDAHLLLELHIDKDPTHIQYSLVDPLMKRTLRELADCLVVNLNKIGLPNVRVLPDHTEADSAPHLDLFHGFSVERLPTLLELYDEYLGKTLDHNRLSQCSLQLHSRDPRLRVKDPEVYEMMTTVEVDDLSPSPDKNGRPAFSEAPHSKSPPNGNAPYPEVGLAEALIQPLPNLTTRPADLKQITGVGCHLNSQYRNGKCNSTFVVGGPVGPNRTDHNIGVKKVLAHQIGDHVLLVDSCSLPGRQGNPVGVNLATGLTGLFDLAAGRRVPQYFTWTLHGLVPLYTHGTMFWRRCESVSQQATNQNENDKSEDLGHQRCRHHSQQLTTTSPISKNVVSKGPSSSCRHLSSSTTGSSNSPSISCTSSAIEVYSQVPRANLILGGNGIVLGKVLIPPIIFHSSRLLSPDAQAPSSLSDPAAETDVSISSRIVDLWNPTRPPLAVTSKRRSSSIKSTHCKCRQLFVMRHAERVDMCFGRAWITRCFDKKGVYRRSNLNLPPWVPPRENYLDYALDSPITQIGLFVAAETGRSLAEAGVHFTVCYSSPSLRCVQTACELLRAMGRTDLLVCIEPHLFEWFGWYTNCAPRMMSPQELRECGYQVDVNYRPLSSSSDFNPAETISSYYDRSGGLTKRLLAMHKAKDSCVLIVAHASSLDTCTRQLVHHGFRSCVSTEEFHQRTSGVPYCGLVLAQEHRRWTLVDPPIPGVCSYGPNPDFDWKQLLGTTLCGLGIKRL